MYLTYNAVVHEAWLLQVDNLDFAVIQAPAQPGQRPEEGVSPADRTLGLDCRSPLGLLRKSILIVTPLFLLLEAMC